MKIGFTVYAEPVAQGRPKFTTIGGHARAYDPKKSSDYKQYIALAASQAILQEPLQGALSLSLRIYRSMPKSFSKKSQERAEAGIIRPITKPDTDNYVKCVKDALKGIVWQDDSQVVAYKEPFGKYYSIRPRIEIEVETMEETT